MEKVTIESHHERWMTLALTLAKAAADINEVPVGAVVVIDNKLIGWGYNRREIDRLTIKHAEIEALTMASKTISSWRLPRCTVYVTLEPCIMCAGALLQARVQQVVYGAKDPKAGAMGSLYSLHSDPRLNHQIEVLHGILGNQAGQLLSNFFRQKRQEKLRNNL